MKRFLRVVIGIPVIAYLACRDRGFRAWLKTQKPAATARQRPRPDKLTLVEDIDVHIAATVSGTANAAKVVALLFFHRGFWNIIREIYQNAFSRQVEGALERRRKP